MKAIIIDDEVNSRESLKNIIGTFCSDVVIIAEAESIEAGAKILKKHHCHIVFLDVQLTDGTGFDLIPLMNKRGQKAIFISASIDFAVNAFKVNALDYLLKPFDPSELCDAIDKARRIIMQEQIQEQITDMNALISGQGFTGGKHKKIVLKTDDSIYIIDITDIIRIESVNNHTRFYLSNGPPLEVPIALEEHEKTLKSSGFIRPNKSHLVNFDYINRFDTAGLSCLVMKDGYKIPVA
ncbi:MAG: LytTR family DNA-binding domain-containing protein [Bacteroidales bacterium]